MNDINSQPAHTARAISAGDPAGGCTVRPIFFKPSYSWIQEFIPAIERRPAALSRARNYIASTTACVGLTTLYFCPADGSIRGIEVGPRGGARELTTEQVRQELLSELTT